MKSSAVAADARQARWARECARSDRGGAIYGMTRHAYLMPVTWSAQFWCGFLLLLVTPAPPAPGGGAAPMLAMCES